MAQASPSVSAEPRTGTKLAAEVAGTFVLVFGLTGTATFSAAFGDSESNPLGVGFFGVAFALGLSVLISAYAFGPVSGGHFNPAVTVGLAVAGKFRWSQVGGYVAAQIVGAIAGASTVFVLAAQGRPGFLDAALDGGFVSNGYGELSPGGFGFGAAIIAEIVGTAIFLLVILGVTHKRGNAATAPLAIGFTLTLLLLVLIPIDNASLNPARSLATALFAGGDWLGQLWVFLVFPLVGGAVGGLIHRAVFEGRSVSA
ncbi:MAG: aquaporin [Mycetocola sp.]